MKRNKSVDFSSSIFPQHEANKDYQHLETAYSDRLVQDEKSRRGEKEKDLNCTSSQMRCSLSTHE
ncbi:MAG: hypothetical protein L0F86_07465, partial [Lactococcus lactis]|nr:hypothetical protein [Lactococcus lactis]